LGDDEDMYSRFGEGMRIIGRTTQPLAMPMAGTRWFRLFAVLKHQGRKSGRAYTTPVVAGRTPDGFVIPLPWGERTQWLKNVLAAGGATLRWNGTDHRLVDPVVADLNEGGGEAFHRVQRFLLQHGGVRKLLRLRIAP
jgi:deazaflavin-dependent oxidoreductase (nitroreductase family)